MDVMSRVNEGTIRAHISAQNPQKAKCSGFSPPQCAQRMREP